MGKRKKGQPKIAQKKKWGKKESVHETKAITAMETKKTWRPKNMQKTIKRENKEKKDTKGEKS